MSHLEGVKFSAVQRDSEPLKESLEEMPVTENHILGFIFEGDRQASRCHAREA